MDALTLLTTRRSTPRLTDPCPAGENLRSILAAGLRVPDFQQLKPFRFLIAEGEGRVRLGELMSKAAAASGQPESVVERASRMPLRAPMIIVVAAVWRESKVVRAFEQQLAAGCAVMAMQMAAVALGFSGVWRSGWPMFDRNLHAALGLAEQDQIVGFLYLGTPREPPDPVAPVNAEAFVSWL